MHLHLLDRSSSVTPARKSVAGSKRGEEGGAGKKVALLSPPGWPGVQGVVL